MEAVSGHAHATTSSTDDQDLILVVEDHPMMLDAISSAIERTGKFSVVTATSGPEGLAAYNKHQPALVLCDISLTSAMSGIELTRRITSVDPEALVVMLTSHSDDDNISASFDAGANGFITKAGASAEDLGKMLEDAVAGVPVYDRVSARSVTRLVRNRNAPPRKALLTPREEEILRLLCSEVVSNKEIGEQLFISEHTVRTHLESLYGKLGVSSKVAASVRALRTGMISESDLPTLSRAANGD